VLLRYPGPHPAADPHHPASTAGRLTITIRERAIS
jgi:hypothetical protein